MVGADEQDFSPARAAGRTGQPGVSELQADRLPPSHTPPPRWLPSPDKVWRLAYTLAAAIFVIWFVAWPIGTMWAHYEVTGIWRFGLGYSGAVVILAMSNALLVLAGGYLLRAALRLEATADRLGRAAERIEPPLTSEAVKADLALLGGEVDKALAKLAKTEQQIRAQVQAIDAAAETMSRGTHQGTERLAKERQALIDATARMNAEADAFAQALSRRSTAAEDEASGTLPKIEEQMKRLEAVSAASAEQFASLREAMVESSELMRQAPKGLAGELQGGADTLRQAQAELLKESEKLHSLIEQQKGRADSLGRTLAQQGEKLRARGGKKNASGSWRGILDKVERDAAEPLLPPRQPAAASPAAQTQTQMKPKAEMHPDEARLDRMQRFTMALKAQLLGMPTGEEQQRFESGERNLFVTQLLSVDPIEMRAQLRSAISEDENLAEAAEMFLSDFDQLLAPVMSDGPQRSDEALQQMLRSPIGRLYVAIGTAKGHFD
jgi:hypothetical protein